MLLGGDILRGSHELWAPFWEVAVVCFGAHCHAIFVSVRR